MGKKSNSNKPALTEAQKKDKKFASFKRVAAPRVNKALKAIGLVGLCASSNYASTEAERKAIVLALQTAVADVEVRFSGEQKAVAGFTLPS